MAACTCIDRVPLVDCANTNPDRGCEPGPLLDFRTMSYSRKSPSLTAFGAALPLRFRRPTKARKKNTPSNNSAKEGLMAVRHSVSNHSDTSQAIGAGARKL